MRVGSQSAVTYACTALFCFCVAAAPLPAQPAQSTHPPAPAYASDAKFQKALAAAKDPRQPPEDRLARWKNANKIAKNECVECLRQIVFFEMRGAQWKDAIASADQLDAISTEPKDKFFAESQRGAALLHANNDNPKPDQLQQAEASLRSALTLAPRTANLVYAEGRVLAMMGRDDDAKGMFQRYLDLVGPADSYRTRAQHFLENPRLAAMHMAPAFTLTTSEGQQLTLDEMGGKVVLLDFWATWCGPCKETLPEIRRVATEFAGQPLVVISISSDEDEAAWRAFMAKNQMTWPQYRDANGALRQAYGVSSIPRFFTIDTDGVLQSVKVGADADIGAEIRQLVTRARDAEKKKAKESESVSSGE